MLRVKHIKAATNPFGGTVGRLFHAGCNSLKEYTEEYLDGHTAQRFADRAQIEVHGGKGGNGCISHEILSPGRKRASGGSGGKGGNVFIQGDPNMFSLKFETYHFNGGHGRHGGSAGLTGRSGEDVYIKVPLGTIISERFPDEEDDDEDLSMYDDFDESDLDATEQEQDGESRDGDNNGWELLPEGEEEPVEDRSQGPEPVHIDNPRVVYLVARGGAAGIGNKMMMKSKNGSEAGGTNQQLQSMPKTYIPGQHGESRSLVLELKIIADVGLVGFPNAGKSSLLRALSNAVPKVASYRFTTLHPSVGVVEYSDHSRITVADIPGLVEGAADNRGLGHDFLRHIERTKLLLYVVDASASEAGRTPAADLLALHEELRLYDEELLQKPALVLANKYDLDVSEKHRAKLDRTAAKLGLEVLPGSAMAGNGIPLVARRLREILTQKKSQSARTVSEYDGDAAQFVDKEQNTPVVVDATSEAGARKGRRKSALDGIVARRKKTIASTSVDEQ